MEGFPMTPKKRTQKPVLYALSTCIWCRRTRELLDKAGVDYKLCEVDTLTGDERSAALSEMRKYNPRGSFPTLVCGDDIVLGYDEDRIKMVLGI